MTILVSQIFSGLFGFQLIRVHIGHQDVYVFIEIALRLINFYRGKGHKKHSIENEGPKCVGHCTLDFWSMCM